MTTGKPLLRRQPSMEEERMAFRHLASPATNVFVNRTWHLSPLAIIETAVVSITLFPIRLVLTLVNLLLLVAVASVGTACMSRQALQAPLPAWRRVLLWPLRPLLRLQLFLWSVHWITVRGRIAPKATAPILTPNHLCFLEPVALMALAGGTPVSAIENARLPLVGSVFVAMQTMFVERGGAAGSGTAAPDRVKALIRDRATNPAFPRVLIFPEGTCTNGSAVISFKTGAFSPGVPVQPVSIRFPWAAHFDPSWSSGPGMFELLFRLLTRLHTPMEVHFMPPYVPSAAEQADARLYAANVQQTIARDLGVRATLHSFEDVLLAGAAQRARYPVEVAVVEFQALRSVLQIDARMARGYLHRFMQADPQKTGRLTFEQFRDLLVALAPPTPSEGSTPTPIESDAQAAAGAAAMPEPPAHVVPLRRSESAGLIDKDEELQRLFSLLDVDDSGTLDFRELLMGLAIINNHGVHHDDDSLIMAFRLLDVAGTGRLTPKQLQAGLRLVWPTVPQAALDAAFAEADTNQDGRVSPAEFVAWAKRHPTFLPEFRRQLLGWEELDAVAISARNGSVAGTVADPAKGKGGTVSPAAVAPQPTTPSPTATAPLLPGASTATTESPAAAC